MGDSKCENFHAATNRNIVPRRLSRFLLWTRAPFLRASERPIAIACSRLVTLPPLPPGPDRRVPRFSRCIALFTLLLAPGLYFRPPDFFFVAMKILLP